MSSKPHLRAVVDGETVAVSRDHAETIRVALEEWGEANCGKEDFTECGDPFCRDFAAALEAIREELELGKTESHFRGPEYNTENITPHG